MPALKISDLTHATTPVFPQGLMFIEREHSGQLRVWSAETFQKAVNKAAAWATLQKKYDLADDISRAEDLSTLRKVLAKALEGLEAYGWNDFKKISLLSLDTKAIAQGHILGWLKRKQEIEVEYE